jgi:hypothetical protein
VQPPHPPRARRPERDDTPSPPAMEVGCERRLPADAVIENQVARRRDHASDRGEADRRQPVKKSSPDAGDRRRDREPDLVDDACGQQCLRDRELAWTPISPPGRFFRSRTKSTSPPSIALALAHSGSSGTDVATYFGTVLMNVANGSISLPGQNPTHSS